MNVLPTTLRGQKQRLEALHSYAILDSAPEDDFDDLARLAAKFCETPVAAVSLVDGPRIWFKAKIGLTIAETSSESSFCEQAIGQEDLFVVHDATCDDRFTAYPLVAGEPRIRFYAGLPLLSPDGQPLGTLCVMDRVARDLRLDQRESLRMLARQVMTQLELRRHTRQLAEVRAERSRLLKNRDELRESEWKYRQMVEHANSIILRWTRDGRITFLNEFGQAFFGYRPEEIIGKHVVGTIVPETESTSRDLRPLMEQILKNPRAFEQNVNENIRRNGERVWIAWTNKIVEDTRGEIVEVLSIGLDITERKQAESALRESETRHRFLFDRNPMPMLIYERGSLRLLAVNEAFILHYGYRREEALALVLPDLYPDEEKARLVELVPRLRGHTYVGEWRHRKRDGSLITIVVSSHDLLYQAREARVVVMTDITGRKATEEQNRLLKERFEALFNLMPQPVVISRLTDGLIVDANRRFLANNGRTREEAVGRLSMELGLWENPEDRSAFLEEIRLNGFCSGREARFLRKDGSLYLAALYSAVIELEGTPHLISLCFDITDRKHAEEALRRERDFSQLLIESLPAFFAAIGADGKAIMMNQCMLQALGYSLEEVRGADYLKFVPDREHKLVAGAFQQIVSARQSVTIENHVLTRDGRQLLVEWHGRPVFKGNSLDYFIGLGIDITELKRTEELALAKERAESADRLKSAFLATMSHELRTPLNSIIGFTGIILQGLAGPLNAEQTKQLSMVQSSARHLLALINDVLDISKIEAGQLEIRAEPFDLRSALERVAALIRPMAEKKKLSLRVELPSPMPLFLGDTLRVEQVLLNLLNNAIKFTDHGEVALVAETRCAGDSEVSAACLHVIDTGIGIKTEDLDKLFLPFRQIDSGLTRQHEGTGLGLAICRRLAKLLGGEITVQSVWGRGSTFTFLLPANPANTLKKS